MCVCVCVVVTTICALWNASFYFSDADAQWSLKIQVKYEFGANQIFESVQDGSFSTEFDSYLTERRANTLAEPNYDQLTYQDLRFDILYDAPFLNIINETDGRREHRSFSVDCSPRLLGLSHAGSFVNVYVVCIETGNCQSHHELRVVPFSTSYCASRKDTWCKNPGGPLTLTTDVPCSEKLPRMAIASIDTDIMILLDSDPKSGFLDCILVQRGQPQCRLGGDVLPKNRLDNQYFYNASSQETLIQVQLKETHSFSQYMIDQFGSIRLLYSSDSPEQNPPCPMLSPNIFNCTVGMKFMNGTKLVVLTDAIGKPQGFQSSAGTNGVAYVMQAREQAAVVVLLPSLNGGQVLDNSTWVCRDSTLVEPVYVLKGGTVIVVALCFPNGDRVFQMYLYQVKEARYELVPTDQPLQLGSVRFGRVLNVLLIGQPFLLPTDATLATTVLPPDGPSENSPAPLLGGIIGGTLGAITALLLSVFVITGIIIFGILRKWKKYNHNRFNDKESNVELLPTQNGGECKRFICRLCFRRLPYAERQTEDEDDEFPNATREVISGNLEAVLPDETEELTFSGDMVSYRAQIRQGTIAPIATDKPSDSPDHESARRNLDQRVRTGAFTVTQSPSLCEPPTGPILVMAEVHPRLETDSTSPVLQVPTPLASIEASTPSANTEAPSLSTRAEAPSPPSTELPTSSANTEAPTPSASIEAPTPSTRAEVPTLSTNIKATTSSTRTELPTPSTNTEAPTPSTSVESPPPSTNIELPAPSANTEALSPSTRAELPTPSVSIEAPSPFTRADAPTQSTNTEAPTPSTNIEAPTPSINTEVPTVSVNKEKATPSANTETPSPSTKAEAPTLPIRAEALPLPTRTKLSTLSANAERPTPYIRTEAPTLTASIEAPTPSSNTEASTPSWVLSSSASCKGRISHPLMHGQTACSDIWPLLLLCNTCP